MILYMLSEIYWEAFLDIAPIVITIDVIILLALAIVFKEAAAFFLMLQILPLGYFPINWLVSSQGVFFRIIGWILMFTLDISFFFTLWLLIMCIIKSSIWKKRKK